MASEETALLSSNGNSNGDVENNALEAESGTPNSISDQSDPLNRILTDELQYKWPATFERSISLLASPSINTRQADLFTKSPKIGGTPIALRKLRRGYETPEHVLKPAGARKDGDDFDKGVNKTHSLDYASKIGSKPKSDFKPIATEQLKLQQKSEAAKEYRKKLLEKQKKETGDESKPKKASAHELEIDSLATFSQCVFNMSNILMGVGLLALPFACKSAGWFGGLFCLAAMGIVTWRTSILIGRELNGDPRPTTFFDDSPFKTPLEPGSAPNARMRNPIKSFPDIAREAYGDIGCYILALILYFELYSCVAIFLVTVGDHLHTLFPQFSKEQLVVLAGIISCIPTVLLHNARLLSYFSMIGTVATCCVVLTVAIAAFFEGDISDSIEGPESVSKEDHEPNHILWRSGTGIPIAFGLVAYCFSGHAIVPSIYSSMKNPQEFEAMITCSYLIVIFACLLVGGSGYYMFGAQVLDQVTLSLEQHSSAVFVMKILTWLMILTALSKTTLTIYPLSLGTEEIIAPYIQSEQSMRYASSLIKLVWTLLALVVALYVPSFSFICSLVGLICTMAVSVIFPAAAHAKLFGSKLSWWEKSLDWIFVIFGLLVAIVGTIVTV